MYRKILVCEQSLGILYNLECTRWLFTFCWCGEGGGTLQCRGEGGGGGGW